MQRIVITLADELYAELEAASAKVSELGFKPETWAQEAVESALASRRLAYVQPSSHRAFRHGVNDADTELEGYPVHWPEGISEAG